MSRDAPIFGFNEHKAQIVAAVVRRVTEAEKDPLHVLNDAAYLEMRRLKHGPEHAVWRTLAGALGRLTDQQLKDKLAELVEGYAWDIAGNFNPRVYGFAARAMPPLLGAVLSPRAAARHLHKLTHLSSLDDRILVQGPAEHVRKLTKLGTVVFVPTHLSNLDSVVFGFALERSELPPATYGAGKNLFTNPVLSFFMHNLGAYRVDRRLRHALYKNVLKAYSCLLIERGYHSLFFPGGTRSRSGGVERRIKLGLAGTGVEAFARTAMRGTPQKVFFVPATINYLLTLEAETLVEDFLQEAGKARYIIEDDESTRIGRIASFVQKVFRLGDSVVIRLCRPLDPFGNAVDEDGMSHDASGRLVDPVSYVVGRDDTPCVDALRDAQYTRDLGIAICDEYRRNTVVMVTHVVSACAFERLRRWIGKVDLFGILAHRDSVVLPRQDLVADIEALALKLRELDARGEIVLSAAVRDGTPDQILDEGMGALASYHTQPVLRASGPNIVLGDANLLFYYQNRLAAHGLAFDILAPARPSIGRSSLELASAAASPAVTKQSVKYSGVM